VAHIALVSGVEKGHVNPMVGVAQWLARLGHHVTWLCIPSASEQVRRAGIDCVGLQNGLADASAAKAPETPPLATSGPALAALIRQPGALRQWIRALLLDVVPSQIEPCRQQLRQLRPDLVALDPMLYQAVIAAHLERLPWVSLSSSLNPVTPASMADETELGRTVTTLDADRRALFRAYGLAPGFRLCDCLSPWLTVVFATEEYLGPWAARPARVRLVGPSLPPAARGDEPPLSSLALDSERPLVYVSFGSQAFHQPARFALLAEAAAPLGAQLLFSAGTLAGDAALANLPGRVTAVPYVPQLAVLQRTALFVSHGGANSVMEALWAGVPMLLSPLCNDQPIQARFATARGVARVVDLDTTDSQALREVLRQLLDSAAPERGATAQVSASYRAHDGARAAATAIASLVEK
jgi:MGT family glycosyltransferase